MNFDEELYLSVTEDDREIDERERNEKHEDEREEGNRGLVKSAYINRNLIFSDAYIDAFKSLGENKLCTKSLYESARKILEHHHGDEYEDLYFIDSELNRVLSQTNYREETLKVGPTKSMLRALNKDIIAIHNHPRNGLPSFEDLRACEQRNYKYGLVVCHNGNVYKYKNVGELDETKYMSETTKYYKEEYGIASYLDEKERKALHKSHFNTLKDNLAKSGIIIEEVLWHV